MQIVALILFWIVIIELCIALNIWLGTIAYGWYIRRKQARSAQKKEE